jgi:exosortase/archaeosortase family protein
LRSVVSLASVGILMAWATNGSLYRRAMLILATIPISVFANGLRVAGTGAAAEAWGPAMTKDPWHTLAGWITFVVSLSIVWAIRAALLEREPAVPARPLEEAA